MRTIRLEEPGRFIMLELPEPGRPGPGEALVQIRRIGICGTDLHAFRGRQPFFTYPRILGHELGVVVEAVGPNERGIAVGDQCSVEPYLNCGKCVACRRGKTNCCTTLHVLGVHTDGGMRERLIVPIEMLHKSTRLTLDQLALVETLGIGAHAVDRGQLERGETVLVIGAGPIGLSVIQFAKIAGARIIVLDVNEARLEFCRRQLGVDHTVDANGHVVEKLSALTSGDLPTVVFDATGNPQSMMSSFDFVANGGKLVFVGLFQGDVTFHDPNFHRREMTLLSSRNSTSRDFTRIIRLIEEGVVDTTPWITHRSPFDTMIAQFPSWLEPANRVIKSMVEVGDA
jgi:2-desacetyl-2-hydroxyethyl bacteriochlorophyllide A dehydrogenase